MSKFILPSGVLKQHSVILGKTGSGKSSVLRYMVEHLLDQGKRVCVIDPKGDWFGIKASADGCGPGYPVILFGDFKNPNASDVPINAQSGKHVAELITSGNRPCIIGFRGWMTSHMTQFWIDFAAGIFNANSGELFLVGDEFHNFAPKGKIMDPQAGKCLHWSNRLLSEGRGLGIVCLLASQRPQKVHNDTLTSCETLIAMRVIHAADRGAVEDWIKGCGDKEQGKEVLNSLAGMARGEAYVWSPEIDFGPKRLAFPMFKTFDSFAPPQLQKRVNEKGWADVDLTAVKEKLAAVIELEKANDPKELHKKISDLRRELAKKPTAPIEIKTKRVEVPVLKDGEIKQLKRFVGIIENCATHYNDTKYTMESALGNVNIILKEINKALATVVKPTQTLPFPVQYLPPLKGPVLPTRLAKGNGAEQPTKSLRAGAMRMLTAVSTWSPNGMTEGQMRSHAGLKKSGTFSAYMSDLRAGQYIEERDGMVYATATGLDLCQHAPSAPTTTDDVLAVWNPKLRDGARRMLAVLVESGGHALLKEELGKRANLQKSGTFSAYLSDLKTAQLVVVSRDGTVSANKETLFL